MTTRLTVGDMTIHRVIEQEMPFFHPLEFLPDMTQDQLEENRHWLEPTLIDPATGHIKLCIQSYIVRTPQHTILVDSCVGNDKERTTRPFWHMKTDDSYMRSLAAAGIGVDDIDFVMCTHLHVDHVGWNTRLENGRWVPTFPNARYIFSQREFDYWSEQHRATPVACIADSVLPIVEAKRADFVRSDHALNDYVRLEPTPGHTPDHFCVRLGKTGREAVVTGDMIHTPIQARYPDLSTRVDFDKKQAAASRRTFLERYCDTDTLICTAHFPSPSVGHFTRWGDGFRFKTEAW